MSDDNQNEVVKAAQEVFAYYNFPKNDGKLETKLFGTLMRCLG